MYEFIAIIILLLLSIQSSLLTTNLDAQLASAETPSLCNSNNQEKQNVINNDLVLYESENLVAEGKMILSHPSNWTVHGERIGTFRNSPIVQLSPVAKDANTENSARYNANL